MEDDLKKNGKKMEEGKKMEKMKNLRPTPEFLVFFVKKTEKC